MKRFIPFLLLVFLLLPIPAGSQRASAEGEKYAVAAERNVWFYSEPDESKGLFMLPYTYYVKVLAEGDPYCHVEYQDATEGYKTLTGYCRRDALTFVDFVPARPFLKKRVTLTYSIDSGNGFGSGSFNSMERTVCFYGTFASGTAQYYYVYGEGVFDYVPATTPVTYDLNTDYLKPATGGDVEPNDPTTGNSGISGVEIAIVCLLCAAAVVVAFFVLRGKKSPVQRDDPEE